MIEEHHQAEDVNLAFIGGSTYLNVGDKLLSENHRYYVTMQDDGNLVIYHDTTMMRSIDNITSSGSATGALKAIWSSRTSGNLGAYFLALKEDGNLGVFPGENGEEAGEKIWATRSKPKVGQYYMVMQDDGKLAIFRGPDPEHGSGLVRRMRPRYAKKGGK